MQRRWYAAALAILAYTGHARACGGGGVTAADQGIVANSQRVVISVNRNGTTDVIAEIGVPQTSADYGVLIPAPAEPMLDAEPVSQAALDQLDSRTRPKIIREYYDSNDRAGCGCGSGGDDDSASAGAAAGVSASQPTNIGPVTATVVTASDATALNDWLTQNGFVIPDERQDLIASYVGAGRYFIAVKRNNAVATGGPTSIGLHYVLEGDHRLLSLAFARLGAAPTVAFTVFLFGSMTGPSEPFQALTLQDLDRQRLMADDYEGAVQAAVKAHGGAAFVVEEALGPPALSNPGLPINASTSLVRMTTVLAADDLTQDATFLTPLTFPIENTRFLDVHRTTPKAASAGLLGLVVLASGVRRRRRARQLSRHDGLG